MGASPGRAAAVPRLVGDDLQEPGAKRPRAEASDRPVSLEEGVLDGVLCLDARAGDEPGGAEGKLFIHAQQDLEGQDVAELGPRGERGIVRLVRHGRP
jgi:hypothetical protein